MRQHRLISVFLVFLCLFLVPARASEVCVPAGHSIQQAIDLAPDGATIYIEPGEYEGHLSVRKAISLVGSEDPANPTILRSATMRPTVTIEGDASVSLEALIIEGARRFRIDAVVVYGEADALLHGVEIRGSRSNAINIYSSGTIEITGCRIHSNEGIGILVQTDSATVIGQENDLRGNGAELGLYAPSELRTFLAEQTESMHVRVPADYETIQEAIDAVAPGGVVEVADGTFSQGLTVWKSVTLRGQGVNATRLEAPGRALYGGTALRCVELLLIESMALGGPWSICGDEATLQDVEVACFGGLGIELRISVSAKLESVRIHSVRGPGLRLAESSRAALDRCSIAECWEGVQVNDHASVTMVSCSIRACTATGMVVVGPGAVSAFETEFIGNTKGIAAGGNPRLTIERCLFDRTLSHAVDTGQADVRMTTCVLRRSGDMALVVGAGYAVVEDCTISETSGQSAVLCAGSGRLALVDCTITENLGYGMTASQTGILEMTRCTVTMNALSDDEWLGASGIGVTDRSTVVLSGCLIEEQNVSIAGESSVRIEDCRMAGNDPIGILISGSGTVEVDQCVLGGHAIGVALTGTPRVALTDCEITGNPGYGLLIYCLDCSGGRHLYNPDLDFAGELTGSGNIISDGSGLSGNGLGGICPAGWEFLLKGSSEPWEG